MAYKKKNNRHVGRQKHVENPRDASRKLRSDEGSAGVFEMPSYGVLSFFDKRKKKNDNFPPRFSVHYVKMEFRRKFYGRRGNTMKFNVSSVCLTRGGIFIEWVGGYILRSLRFIFNRHYRLRFSFVFSAHNLDG